MFRFSSTKSIARQAFLSPLSAPTPVGAPFHTLSTQYASVKRVNPKKAQLKRKILIATLLQKKRHATKKLKSAGKRPGVSKALRPKTVSPNMGKAVPRKKGAKSAPLPAGMSFVDKDAVYDAMPRFRNAWPVRKAQAIELNYFNRNFPRSIPLLKFLKSRLNVDRDALKFNAKDEPILKPLFYVTGLSDASAFVNKFYASFEKAAANLADEKQRSSLSPQRASQMLIALDELIAQAHNFESVLVATGKYARSQRLASEFKKFHNDFYESVPQVIAKHGEQLTQLCEAIAPKITSEERPTLTQVEYWLKRYGAKVGPKGYNAYLTAWRNLNKHIADVEKKVDSVALISLPVGYIYQIPPHLRPEVEKYKTKFVGIDSYKLNAVNHLLTALRTVRDPTVRRDLFNQAREAVDGVKGKYLPLIAQTAQLGNKLAQSLGFESLVDMQVESRYGLKTDTMRDTLFNVAKNGYDDTYINELVKSKQRELEVWKYSDRAKDSIPDYDKMHAEQTHFNDILGHFNRHHLKTYLPLHMALRVLFDDVEKTHGVTIKTSLAQPGELWDDCAVKKFIITDTKTKEVISHLYLDIFPREGKDKGTFESRVDVLTATKGEGRKASTIPSVVIHSLVDSPHMSVPCTLTHAQLRTLCRLVGEAVYAGVISPQSTQSHVLRSNPLAQKAMGAYFARKADNMSFMKQIAGNVVTKHLIDESVLEDMMITDPVLRPMAFSEAAAQSILDLDLFSGKKTTYDDALASLESALEKGSLQPDFSLGTNVETNGALSLEVYSELLGSAMAAREKNKELTARQLQKVPLSLQEQSNALMEELRALGQSGARMQRLISEYNRKKEEEEKRLAPLKEYEAEVKERRKMKEQKTLAYEVRNWQREGAALPEEFRARLLKHFTWTKEHDEKLFAQKEKEIQSAFKAQEKGFKTPTINFNDLDWYTPSSAAAKAAITPSASASENDSDSDSKRSQEAV